MTQEQAHPTRLALAALFADGRECTVTDAYNALVHDRSVSPQNIRGHMSTMMKMGLLRREFVNTGMAVYRRAAQ